MRVNLTSLGSTFANVLLAALLGFLLKTFFFSFYTVPSGSMENSLLPGDGILISKLSYGPRINFTQNSELTSGVIQLPGFGKITRNDLIVFDSPKERDLTLVKRCVGLPGEVIQFNNETLLINKNVIQEDFPLYKFWVYTKKPGALEPLLDSLKLNSDQYYYRYSKGYYVMTITIDNLSKIKKAKSVDSVKREINQEQGNSGENWSKDKYGPVTIPKKGFTIKLDSLSMSIYLDLILMENKHVKYTKGGISIENQIRKTYTFKNNYYFMMGDNRDNSTDSRFIGFIPEPFIIGKVILVLYSLDYSKNSLRKERFLKAMH